MQLSKSNFKTTLNYLKNNNIPYHINNKTLISFPQTSPQYEQLYCTQTKQINNERNGVSCSTTPIILIHNF